MSRTTISALTLALLLSASSAQAYFAQAYTLVEFAVPHGYPTLMDKSENRVITTTTVVQDGTAVSTAAQLSPSYQVLGSFAAAAVNWPWVAGTNSTGDAVLYHHGVLDVLPSLDDAQASYATCVNNSGDVFGQSAGHPVVWLNGAQTPSLLPTEGYVYTCNDRGDAAGQSPQFQCIFWGQNGTVVDCHDPARAYSVARDMTSTGMIAAWAWPEKFHTPVVSYVWMWSGIAQLPPYAPQVGRPSSFVTALNERGDAVGTAYRSDPEADSPPFAVGWEHGSAFRIAERVVNLPAGMVVKRTWGIANDGTILVDIGPDAALDPRDDLRVTGLALLTPVETPVIAYDNWRFRIWQYYVNQYWRTIRDWSVASKRSR